MLFAKLLIIYPYNLLNTQIIRTFAPNSRFLILTTIITTQISIFYEKNLSLFECTAYQCN